MSKVKKARIILYSLLVLWMIFIYVLSAQQASESSQLSGGIVNKLITAFFKNYNSMSADGQADIVHTTTFWVRKIAHFSEYFILGLLSSLITLSYNNIRNKFKIIIPIVFCLLYATSDEMHQRFVAGRACRFSDVCIDGAGSILAIVLTILIAHMVKKDKAGKLNAKKEIN